MLIAFGIITCSVTQPVKGKNMHPEDKPKNARDLLKYFNKHGRFPDGSEELVAEIKARNAIHMKQLLEKRQQEKEREESILNSIAEMVDEVFEAPAINTVDEFLADLFK